MGNMESKQRVLAAISRLAIDRIPITYSANTISP